VTLLLDTHCFLWYVLDDPKLTVPAKLATEEPTNAVLVSPASYWEIAIKISAGKYRLNRSYDEFWRRGMVENNIGVLPIELRHTSQLVSLPFHHKDPFDRLLVAQTLTEHISLVSGDTTLDAYGIQRIW
jgi:PIN domain nuclease of toxin-antitoxin system